MSIDIQLLSGVERIRILGAKVGQKHSPHDVGVVHLGAGLFFEATAEICVRGCQALVVPKH